MFGAAFTPSFLFDLESNMRTISERQYQRLSSKTWWQSVAKRMPSGSKKERLTWLLETAKIEYVNKMGGEVNYEDILAQTTEFEQKAATAGLRLHKHQFEDLDGNGVNLATHWSSQIGAYGAYWPQKQIAKAIRDGDQSTSLAYDGVQFFSSAGHNNNPFDSSAGSYKNLLTGAASGSYPGACPIDETNAATTDVAFKNLGKAITYVNSAVLMPNGEDPRMLRVTGVLVPTALMVRATQLTNAKYIAQGAASGGGSADVEAVIREWGIGQPIEAPELGAAFTNGSDTSYYLLAQEITSDELGALTYIEREPFSVVYHDGMTDVELLRANELEWVCRGRNVVGYGHPYLIFQVNAT